MTPAPHLEALSPAESSLPAPSDAAAVDRALDELEGAEAVEATHPELLEQSAPTGVAPSHPELLEAVPPAAPAQPAARPSSPPPERSPEAVARLRRRVRQNLRGAQGLEMLRDVLERARLSGLSPTDLEAEVAKVGEEKRKDAGRGRAALQAAEEWARLARAACAQLAPPPVVEEVSASPQPEAAPSPPPPESPAAEPPVMVMGQPIERVAHFAEPIQWFLKSLAELTKGTAFDLTRSHEGVIFRGTPAEREIKGDPCTRLTELLAVRKASKVEVTEGEEVETESPGWELLAYGAAVTVALVQKHGNVVAKLGDMAKRGSVGAARAAARAVKGFGGRRK